MKEKGRLRRGLQKKLQSQEQATATATNIRELCDSSALPSGWNNLANDSRDESRLCKVSSQSGTSEPLKVSHSIIINSDITRNVYVHGNQVSCRRNTPLSQIPDKLSTESLQSLISIVDGATVYVVWW